MPKTVRGKFKCVSTARECWNPQQTNYTFSPVDEAEWAQYTPNGTLELTVDNPEVSFELGALYFVDVTRAEPEEDPS